MVNLLFGFPDFSLPYELTCSTCSFKNQSRFFLVEIHKKGPLDSLKNGNRLLGNNKLMFFAVFMSAKPHTLTLNFSMRAVATWRLSAEKFNTLLRVFVS